jgi:hypothetical protein
MTNFSELNSAIGLKSSTNNIGSIVNLFLPATLTPAGVIVWLHVRVVLGFAG